MEHIQSVTLTQLLIALIKHTVGIHSSVLSFLSLSSQIMRSYVPPRSTLSVFLLLCNPTPHVCPSDAKLSARKWVSAVFRNCDNFVPKSGCILNTSACHDPGSNSKWHMWHSGQNLNYATPPCGGLGICHFCFPFVQPQVGSRQSNRSFKKVMKFFVTL